MLRGFIHKHSSTTSQHFTAVFGGHLSQQKWVVQIFVQLWTGSVLNRKWAVLHNTSGFVRQKLKQWLLAAINCFLYNQHQSEIGEQGIPCKIQTMRRMGRAGGNT